MPWTVHPCIGPFLKCNYLILMILILQYLEVLCFLSLESRSSLFGQVVDNSGEFDCSQKTRSLWLVGDKDRLQRREVFLPALFHFTLD